MDTDKLKIILLDDNKENVLKISDVLDSQKLKYEFIEVNSKTQYEQKLKQLCADVVICNFYFSAFKPMEAIGSIKSLKLDIPFVLITDSLNEDFAISLLKNDCSDYILDNQLKRLPHCILKTIELYKSKKKNNDSELLIKFNEDKYNSIIHYLPSNIAIIDESGVIVYVNPQWKLFAEENGYKAPNYGIGSNYIETCKMCDDQDGILFANSIEKIINGKLFDFSMIYSCHSPDKKRWFKAIASRERGDSGSRIIIMHIDVTEQQESKLKAQENEAKLVEAQKAAKVGSWETDLTSLKVIWSEETYKIFELDPSIYQPTHESFLSFVHEEDKAIVNDAFFKSFQSNHYNSLEHRIITSKGNLKYIEEHWKIIFDENGTSTSAFGTCQDITERKMAEAEFLATKKRAEENEFRLKLATESAKLGVWDWDITRNKIVWDDTMHTIFGQPNNITNRFESWLNSLHPDDKGNVLMEVGSALKGEKNFDTSFRIIKPDDTVAFIKANGLVLCDTLGNSSRMIGINRDITEQKLADDRLINSNHRLINILQNSPIACCLTRLDHSVIVYNVQYTKLFGYTIDDIPNLKKWWITAYPDQNYRETVKKEWYSKIEYAQETHTQFAPMQAKVRCKDGSDKFIEFHYAKIEDEFLVVFNDITERIKYEEQLALSSWIIDSIGDAIISKSIDGIVTSWNHAAEKLLGYRADEMIGKTTDHLKSSKTLIEEERDIIEKVNKGESVHHYETKRIKKDGEEIDVSLIVSPIKDVNGNITGVSKIFRDITYQKRIEEEREKTMNNLIQRNRDLEQFSYIISHNLRGPVATILGLTNLLHNTQLSATEEKKVMDGVFKYVNNLDSVIKDLNVILQVKGQGNEKKSLVMISDVIGEIELSLKDTIQKEKVEIRCNFDAIDEAITLKSYMYSIFYNLILNSIKYRQLYLDPVIDIKSEIFDGNLIITIKDNGIGIDLNKHSHEIFGLNKRFNFNVEGKGLGLFMVKTQVESLGGKIEVQSQLNAGTIFTITLPR